MRQEEVHRIPNPIAMGSIPPMEFANTQPYHPHSVVEEGHLEEMVNDLLAHEEDVACDDDCQCVRSKGKLWRTCCSRLVALHFMMW